MKIWSVTPVRVDAHELARRRDRYRDIAPPGCAVTLAAAGSGAPARFATEDDIGASTAATLDALKAPPGDGVTYRMPDCVLDPGVPLTPDPAPVPVVGMLRLTAAHLVATGRPFGAVTRNRAIGDALAARIDEYGHGPWFAGVSVLDLDFEAIADTERWNDTVRAALDGFTARGVTAVVNGCSAVTVQDEDALPPAPATARLIDPARLALRLLTAGSAA
ncbi:aspartate/glutamate racemase family protein [Streptomyces sp. NPDC002911]